MRKLKVKKKKKKAETRKVSCTRDFRSISRRQGMGNGWEQKSPTIGRKVLGWQRCVRKRNGLCILPVCSMTSSVDPSLSIRRPVFFIKPPGRLPCRPSPNVLLKCANAFPEKPSNSRCLSATRDVRRILWPAFLLHPRRSSLLGTTENWKWGRKGREIGAVGGGLRKYRIESVEKQ